MFSSAFMALKAFAGLQSGGYGLQRLVKRNLQLFCETVIDHKPLWHIPRFYSSSGSRFRVGVPGLLS